MQGTLVTVLVSDLDGGAAAWSMHHAPTAAALEFLKSVEKLFPQLLVIILCTSLNTVILQSIVVNE